jgi:predicted dehydrogenase
VGTVSATRFATGHLNDLRLRLYGDTGGLDVLFEQGESRLNACLGADIATGTWETVATPEVPTIYQLFAAAIHGTAAGQPNFARGAALQQVLDLAEASARSGCRSLEVTD